MNRYILIYFLFLNICWGQQIIELPMFVFSHLDQSTNNLKLYDSSSIYCVNLSSLEISERPIQKFDTSKTYFTEQLNNETYLFQNGTGKVFKEREDQIERVDNSIIENFLIDSNFFTYNDTVFRHGGYGYWTIFNKILYYDINTNQWELFKHDVAGRIDHHSFIVNNNVYFLGGHSLSETLPQKNIHNYSIESFSYNTGQFKKLGNTQFLFNGDKIISDNKKEYFIDNKRTIIELNFDANKVKEYFSNSLNTKISNKYKSYITDNKFVFFSDQNGKTFLNIFPVDLFITSPINEYKLIQDDTITQIYIYLLLSIIVLFAFWKIVKNKNVIYLNRTAIRYRFKKNDITPIQYDVLRLLSGNKEIKSTYIDEIIFENQLSRASNYKKKKEVIFSINDVLKKNTGTGHNVLLEKKSKFDSRMKVFYISRKFRLIKK